MKNIKENKIQSNISLSYNCPVTACMKVIGGKWKPIIIYLVSKDINRFGIISKSIPEISKHILAIQLNELEKDLILDRIDFKEKPFRVEYKLTKKGKTLLPIIQAMEEWGSKVNN